VIGNEDAMSFYELHIAVKDYCTFGDNRLIGVSVMQLKDIENQVPENTHVKGSDTVQPISCLTGLDSTV